MNILSKWLARRKRRAEEALFNQGFDWAAGQLLRDPIEGEQTIEAHTDSAQTFGTFNKFDAGALSALMHWHERF